MHRPARSARRVALSVCALIVVGAAAIAGIAWHEGYRIYVVHTGSMTPSLNPGDAVLDRPASTSVRRGEVVTFGVHSGPDSVVTHRVASVSDGGIKTKGDANRSVDPWTVQLSDVVGSKLLTLPYGGYVVVYLQHPQGIASVLTALIAMILLWYLFFPPTTPRADADAHSRHRHAAERGNNDELSPAVFAPSARWLDVSHAAPTFLGTGLGPLGRSADRRSYFD
jgi:signal peptidase